MDPEIDESYPDELNLRMVPAFLSEKKANAVSALLKFDELLISADTIVLLEKRIYGKPLDEEDARQMLKDLSGKMHEVITGVTLKNQEKSLTFSEVTKVYFTDLSEEVIDFYIKKYQPLDKAGAYGIQDWFGYVGIEKIHGCWYNVMGLPTSRLVKELREFGYEISPV